MHFRTGVRFPPPPLSKARKRRCCLPGFRRRSPSTGVRQPKPLASGAAESHHLLRQVQRGAAQCNPGGGGEARSAHTSRSRTRSGRASPVTSISTSTLRASVSAVEPFRDPRSFTDQPILIEVVNTKMGPCVFERHLHIARHRGGSQSDFRINEFETAASARKRNVEGLSAELVDLGTRLALQDTRYLDPCRPTGQVGLESNRQEQGLANLRTGGCKY